MAAVAWAAPVSNNFNNSGSWNGGVAPGSGDDALLTVAGSSYTVTVNASATVNSLQTASNATLLIGTGLGFSLTNGTGTGANAGQISVSNNSDLYIGGTFNNTNTTGGIVLNGTANNTELRLTGATTTFTGGGAVVMGTGGDNEIQGDAGAANTLTNVNNTISGVGNLGNAAMTFVNQSAGVVNANQTGQLTLNVNGGVTNTGTLEATNTGGLFIVNTGITNTGGVIEATGSGAHVDLQSSTITGGSLESGAGAQIDVVGGQTAYLNGSATAVTITSGSNVNVNNNAYLYASGSIINDGTINLEGTANSTELRLRTPNTTLSGGGQVVMGTGGDNEIQGDVGAANTLTNVNNTISGVGNLGNAALTFVNQAAGVVNANQTSALTINVNGGVTNTGLLEASNSGGLFIVNTAIDNTGGGNSGKISATASGAHVDLQSDTLYGGVLSSAAGAYIDVVGGQSATLDGSQPGGAVTIASGTNVNVNNNAYLYLAGSIVNDGTITLAGTANSTDLRLTTPITTLTGGGQVVLGGSGVGFDYIVANNSAAQELDNVNNTISGQGNIGNGSLTLVNAASAGTFKIDTAQNFTGSVVDFATGDTLDLASINFGSAVLSYAGNSSGGVLTVTDGTETANIKLVGNYTQASFGTAADSGTGTLVTYTGAAAAAIVADTAANLSGTELDALQASGAATSSIVVVDSGKVQTNVAQLTIDAGALAKMTAADEAPYTLKVVDTAANESGAGLDKAQANGHVKYIIVSDNGSSEGGYVQASVAQLTSDASVLSGLAFANGQLTGILNVTDTAAHINPALDALNADTQIGKIVVSDNNVVSATVLQITNDTTALGEMVNANGTSLKIRVDDVAVNMSSGTQLDRVNANSHVTSVIVSDNGLSLGGYVRVTVAQLSSDTKALGELAFANGQTLHTLNVTDSAANISADLTALNSDTQIGRITVNDGHQITLTAAAFNADTTAESEMRGANASTLPLYAITDTAANLNGKSFTGLATGGDAIDATDIAFAHETATFTENSAGTAGTLTLSDGTHSASVTLFGQYAAAGFSGTAVAAGFSVAMDAGTGTKLTLLASVSH